MSPTTVDEKPAKPLSQEAQRSLTVNWAERRRQSVSEDPSLIFGATVFAQLVAGDLARAQLDDEFARNQDSQAGEDAQDVIVQEGAADGFFGTVTSAGNLAPAAGALGVLTGVPSPGSDAGSSSGSSGSGAQASDGTDGSSDAESSTISRSVTAVRRGQQPNADGADQTNADREAAGAQSTATETQQEFVAAGGNPFGAGVPTDTSVMAPNGQSELSVFSAIPVSSTGTVGVLNDAASQTILAGRLASL